MHLQTPLIVDVIVGLIWIAALYLSLFSSDFVVKRFYILALIIWGVTGLANLILGVIPSLPDPNWQSIAYLVASILAIIMLMKAKKNS